MKRTSILKLLFIILLMQSIQGCNSCNKIIPNQILLNPNLDYQVYISDMAISGTHAMVSLFLSRNDPSFLDSIFYIIQCLEYNGKNWEIIQTIKGNCDSLFAPSSVAIDKDYAVVGHPSDCSYKSKADIYVFRVDHWEYVQDILPDDTSEMNYRRYGSDVDINGDYVVVSNPTLDKNTPNLFAYIFKRTNYEWNQVAKITTDKSILDEFGQKVQIGKNICLVSSRWRKSPDDPIVSRRIHVFYAETDNDWKEIQTLDSDTSKNGYYFANSFDYDEPNLVVSSSNYFSVYGNNKGGNLYFYNLVKGKKFALNTIIKRDTIGTTAISESRAITFSNNKAYTYAYESGSFQTENSYPVSNKKYLTKVVTDGNFFMYGRHADHSKGWPEKDSAFIYFQRY